MPNRSHLTRNRVHFIPRRGFVLAYESHNTPRGFVLTYDSTTMLVPMGRPSKGPRTSITAKPDLTLDAVIRRNAELLDMSLGDYLVAIAAHALDMPDHAPAPGRSVEAIEGLAFDESEAPLVPATVAPITDIHTAKELVTKIAS